MGHVYFSNGYADSKDFFNFVGRINFLPNTLDGPFVRKWIEEFCEGAVYIDTRSDYTRDDNGGLSSTNSYYFEDKDDLLKFKVAFGGRS